MGERLEKALELVLEQFRMSQRVLSGFQAGGRGVHVLFVQLEICADAGSVAHPRVVSNALPCSIFTLLK